MTKEEIFNYFYTNSANLGVKNILFCLLGGLLISMLIYITYSLCYKGVAYNKRFNNTLVAILLIAVVIMLMISSNVVISLGMVGALSIVRFRTAIKDARDTVFIFWAIAEGLCVGSQNMELAIYTTLFIGAILILTSSIAFGGKKYFMIITGNHISQEMIHDHLNQLKLKHSIRSSTIQDNHYEYIIEVRAKKETDLQQAGQLEGIETLHWIVESEEMVG